MSKMTNNHIADDGKKVLTDKEIIKGFCNKKFCPLAQEIINRQQEKLEYLQGERECLLEDIKVSSNQVIEQQSEIESLERRLHNAQLHQKETHKALQDERALRLKEDFIRAEAIKEFAEKVKMAFYYEFDELIPSIMADKIDNLVKEMVGEGNG